MQVQYPRASVRNRQEIIRFYRQQLQKFKKLGIGNRTEFRVVVTKKLIAITNKRLSQLTGRMYGA